MAFAAFEEAHDNSEQAESIYVRVCNDLATGHAESVIRFVNFYRRQGRHDMACAVYERGLEAADSGAMAFLSMHYANYLSRHIKQHDKAREVFDIALSKVPDSKNLWLAFIAWEKDIETDKRETRVSTLYERVLASDRLSQEDKLELYSQYVEFLNDYGASIRRYADVH